MVVLPILIISASFVRDSARACIGSFFRSNPHTHLEGAFTIDREYFSTPLRFLYRIKAGCNYL
jgi:hypothetical protein